MILKADIPFSRDDANRFLPWMVALMCAITALMLCVGLTLGQWVSRQHGDFGNSLTVQVPDIGDKYAQAVKSTLDALENSPGVEQVTLMPEKDVRKMVEPWLGSGPMLAALPYPTVIDVTLATPAEGIPDFDSADLKTKLAAIHPDISVDTQEMWVEQFSRFSTLLQTALYILAIFIITGLAGMMIFAARAAMKLHANTVRLLHAIGAEDTYIARQFQQNAFTLALRGAIPGTVLAAIVYALLGYYAAQLESPLTNDLSLTFAHLAMLVLLPLICAAISIIAVRAATLSQLRMLP